MGPSVCRQAWILAHRFSLFGFSHFRATNLRVFRKLLLASVHDLIEKVSTKHKKWHQEDPELHVT